MCSLFVIVHEPRVASHVGGQYRRQPALDPDWPLLHHGPLSDPQYLLRRITRQGQAGFDALTILMSVIGPDPEEIEISRTSAVTGRPAFLAWASSAAT